MKPYVFLDRDGTINQEVSYLRRTEDFRLEEGCVEGLSLLQEKGYGLVVVTNQSGVARGYFTMEHVHRIHRHMIHMLSEYGICIEKIYVCPHGPGAGCVCRKPGVGLFEQAICELSIDVGHSYVVGDRLRDILPAKTLHCGYGALLTGYGKEEDFSQLDPEFIFENLAAFARSVKQIPEGGMNCFSNEEASGYREGGGRLL